MQPNKEDEALKLLKDIKAMTYTIRALGDQIERLYTSLTSTTIKLKEVDVQSSGDPDPMGTRMAEIVEYQEQILEHQRLLCTKKKLALDIVKSMEFKYQSYIVSKYFNGKTIEEIADDQEKSYRWTWEMMHGAEEQFVEKYKEIV